MLRKLLILASLDRSLINFRGALIQLFLKHGFEVHAVAPEVDLQTKNKLEEWGCIIHEVPIQRTGFNPASDIKSLFSLFKLINSIKPDVFIGYTIKPVIYGILAAFFARTPTRCALITGLGFTFTSKTTGIKRFASIIAHSLYKLSLSKATHVLFQNTDDRDLFCYSRLVEYKKCGIVNGSGVDLMYFKETPLPKNPVFLFIGRLLIDKGILEYVKAARKVQSLYPKTRFIVVGSIDSNPTAVSQDELNEWISSGDIEYLGRLNDVRPAINDCSVFVLPSYREGTPRSVLEAMSVGRPVITTDAPGCRETVTDGKNGYLVPVKAVDKLAEAMIRFIDNPSLRATMGQASRVLVTDKYDVHKVNQSIMQQLGIDTSC